MESRLQPLSFHIDWTLSELEEKAMEHMVSNRFRFFLHNYSRKVFLGIISCKTFYFTNDLLDVTLCFSFLLVAFCAKINHQLNNQLL